jgi:starch phosphorylase
MPHGIALSPIFFTAENAYYRLCQEAILGFGGLRMLRALGHHTLTRFHLNEGHA